jgi:hypothetical protein
MLSSLYRVFAPDSRGLAAPSIASSTWNSNRTSDSALKIIFRRGTPPEQAERMGRIELGGITQLHEAQREARGIPLLNTLTRDLRYTSRIQRHNAGFTAFTILIVGLGARGECHPIGQKP